MSIKKLSVVVFICTLFLNTTVAQVRIVAELKDGWKFSKGKNDAAHQTDFNDKAWQTVSVPHD